MRRDELAGKHFGRLVVVGFSHKTERGDLYWACRCSCGNEKTVRAGMLRNGHVQSCGCLQREAVTTHGGTKTRSFKSWESMRQRCNNPNAPDFASYGGRGIKVCDQWADFATFLKDMGERPEGQSLDRIDVNGDYEPGNCRWADPYQQQRNRQGTEYLTHCGLRLSYPDWAARTGVPAKIIRWRLRNGWAVEAALSTPVMEGKGKPITRKD